MCLLPRRKSTSALSYSEESVVPMRTVLPSVLPGSMRTSLEPSIDSKDPVNLLGSGASSVTSFSDVRELSGGYNRYDVIVALDFALVGTLKGCVDGDDPT